MSFVETTTVLKELSEALKALSFSEGDFAGEKVFNSVDSYDVPRIEQALTDLLNFDDRVCLIIPISEDYQSRQKNSSFFTVREGRFLLLISDRDYTPGKPSFYGSETHPGVLQMKEAVINALHGESLDLHQVVITPLGGESIRVSESEKNISNSREGYRLILKISMGSKKQILSPGTLS